MTTKEVAVRAGVCTSTVCKWCADPKNKVAYVGEGVRRTYTLTESDYARFLQRPKPGKRAKEQSKSSCKTKRQ